MYNLPDWWLFFTAPKNFFKMLFHALKMRYQRAIKGYCDDDTYDIATWMTTILPKMLDEINARKCKGSYSTLGKTGEEWTKLLENIADLMRQASPDYEDSNPFKYSSLEEKGTKEWAEAYWQYELNAYHRRQASVKRVFELIAENFYDLGY